MSRWAIFVVCPAPSRTPKKEDAMKRISWLALAAAAGFASASAQEPIAIGVSIAQSPPGSVVQGAQVKDGVEIMKDMINAKGGVLGRPIKLIYQDNQGVPATGRSATEKLITKDKGDAVTGEHQTSLRRPGIDGGDRHETPDGNTNCRADA